MTTESKHPVDFEDLSPRERHACNVVMVAMYELSGGKAGVPINRGDLEGFIADRGLLVMTPGELAQYQLNMIARVAAEGAACALVGGGDA